MIDTHAHIYLDEFVENADDLFRDLKIEGVEKVFMPNIDTTSIDSLNQMEEQYKNRAYSMMGLHPCYVKPENYKEELKTIEQTLRSRTYWGVGEVGVDLYWDKTTYNIQKEVFDLQIEWAKDLRLPIIIHSRDSLDITIDMIQKQQNGNLTGIFHCFNGTQEQAKKIVDIGFYMGIGGVVTFKNAGVDKTVEKLTLDNIVLETDAPYLAPVPYRGKQNSPKYLPLIAKKVAACLDVTVDDVVKHTTHNAEIIFKI